MEKVVYVKLTKLMDEMFSGKALGDDYLSRCYDKLWDIMVKSRGNGDATTQSLLSHFSRRDTYDGDKIVKTVLLYNREELDFRQVEILIRTIFLENLTHNEIHREKPRKRVVSLFFGVPNNKYALCGVY